MSTTVSSGEENRTEAVREEGFNCPEAARVITPELVQALDDLCALARNIGRNDMAEQCAGWAQQLRSVLEMDVESQKKALSDLWLG